MAGVNFTKVAVAALVIENPAPDTDRAGSASRAILLTRPCFVFAFNQSSSLITCDSSNALRPMRIDFDSYYSYALPYQDAPPTSRPPLADLDGFAVLLWGGQVRKISLEDEMRDQVRARDTICALVVDCATGLLKAI